MLARFFILCGGWVVFMMVAEFFVYYDGWLFCVRLWLSFCVNGGGCVFFLMVVVRFLFMMMAEFLV